ncbi:aminodeoxychorismate synthase component I [Brachybacterium sp. DNPG3]
MTPDHEPADTCRTPIARFDDAQAGTVRQIDGIRERIVARTPEEVIPALRAVQAAVDGGAWAVGMVTYEAAAGLDPHAAVHEDPDGPPLVWFGISDEPPTTTQMTAPTTAPASSSAPAAPARTSGTDESRYRVDPWRPEQSAAEHGAAVERVRAAIAEGDTYQVNLTTRLRGRIEGDLLACHDDLIARQRAAHSAYLDIGSWTFLSASPELFVEREGDLLITRPMKGTAARGDGPARDALARADLLGSEKERAENIMIVDLLRNDLARIARTGSVEVPRLLDAEPYPTLWQMTSTVTAQAASGTGLPELFGALFPCGSITGAPKISTMRLIRELESSPRGIYCGAIGLIEPAREIIAEDGTASTAPARSRFNVAIRTIQIDRRDGTAVYGVGSGITWASCAQDEWQELLTKARVLEAISGAAPARGATAPGVTAQAEEPFGLIETLAVDDGAPRHLTEHLERLARSAEALRIPIDRMRVRDLLVRAARGRAPQQGRLDLLRLHLALDGTPTLRTRSISAAGPDDPPLRLAVDTVPVDPEAPAVRHKTTDRAHLTAALRRAEERGDAADDVVLLGREGRVVETTIASLLVRIDGVWWTPPLEDGCLPGIGRRLALERGEIRERPITVAALRAAEEVALLSSVRGMRAATLV